MSKYKIPSTSSTKDPYALERSIAGDSLKPTANPITTSSVGNELETLTPFQIEEGRGTLGNSQFYQQARQNQLANDEDFWSLTAKGLKNIAGTIATEVGKTPGYIGGGIAAAGNELFGDGKDSMKMMVDNSWVNAFESMDESIKNFMPANVKQDVLDGNILDKLGSYGWWATTGADGIGFLLAMYGPGALLKAGKVGQRVMGGIEELTNAGVKTANWLNLPMDAIKPYKMSLSTAGKVDGYAAALTKSVVESAAEAANTFDTVKSNKLQEYLNKGLTQEEAEELSNQDAGKAASAIFKTNMIILPISNLLEEKWLWKSIGLKGQDEASQGIINQFMKNGVLDLDGLKNATKKTFKEQAGTYSKNFLKNFAKEGGGEEGLQTITQQQVEKGNIKDNPLSQLWESISQYTNDFENNKELHESIALGGLLGGGASIFQSINEGRNNEEAIYGSKQGKFDNILNKIGLRQVRKDQRGLSNLLSENWIQNFRSYNDLMTDGKLDETKLAQLPQEQQNLANLHFLYDSAVELGRKDIQESVGQFLSANYAQPFLGQTGGKEIFRQHVENQVVPEWVKRFQEVNNREVTSVEINEYKQRFLSSANKVFDNYKKVEETHYPERYFQDKENTEQYKDFKKFYFDQKFQALTVANDNKQLIVESNAKLLKEGIIEGANLNGIQKTLKKIEESNIKENEASLKEASDYYESLFTKKGVKELYDLFASQRKVVEDTIQEVETDKTKDIKVAEEKVANLTTAETKFQEAESTQDTPITIKTKDGRVLETFVDNDGTRYVNDNSNIRPITEEEQTQSSIIQQEDVEREVKKSSGVEPEFEKGDYDKVLQLAKDNIAGVMQSSPENIQLLSNYPKLFEKYTKEQIGPNISNEEPIDEKLHEAFLQNDLGTGLYPSTGMHVSYDYIKGRIYDRLNSEGLPILNDSVHQRNWFNTLDNIKNINEYQTKVVNKTNANEEQLRVILENGSNQVQDTDLFVFLYKNDSPVLVDSNPVFTALYRPDTLYKDSQDKDKLSARIAPVTVYNSFLESIGIQAQEIIEEDLSNFSPTEQNKLESVIGKSSMSGTGLWYKATQWAKQDYTNWYNSLQQPNTFIQPIAITNGKRLIRRNQDRSIVWNPVKNNIPDFTINNQKLVNGDLVQQYTAQGIKVGNKFYKLGIGDTAIVSNDQIYRLKQKTLNDGEVKTVLYLLSLKNLNSPQESISLPVRTVIKVKNKTNGYSNKVYEETPIFGSNTEYGILKSMINFGFGESKGSIYLNGNNVEFVDFNGTLNTIPIQVIQNAFLDDDFSKIDNLVKFLEQKKFNVNENLLRADSDFQYPVIKRTTNGGYKVDFENKGKYKAFLLEDEKILTDSVIAEGYPKRLSRNLQFAKQPTIQMVQEETTEVVQEPNQDINFVFQQNNELSSVGTKEQYAQYLNTIFPNSKVKDIVFHGTRNTFDKFEKRNKEQYSIENETQTNSLLDGIFFTDRNTALDNYTDENKILKSVILNIQNPLLSDNRRQVSNKNIKNQDGVITVEFIGNSISDVYVVFEPEQIHILGSNNDIQMFKEFMKNQEPKVNPRSERLKNRTRTEIPKLGDVDKILSPTDLLTQKLQNGEITKYCK